MTVRWTLVRVVAGALSGAIVGVVVMLVIADSVAAIGDGHIALYALLLVIPGAPTAGVAGAILGGWGAAAGRSSREVKVVAGTAATLVAVAVLLGVAQLNKRPHVDVDVEGCTISPRDGSLIGHERYTVMYDRYCPGGAGHTVNVSVLPSIHDSVGGPGNALVLAGDSTLEATSGGEIVLMTGFRDPLHLEIVFDHRAHILSQASSVAGLEVVLRPELGLPRRPDQPPAWAARMPPIETPMPVRPARESVVPHRPSTPGGAP